MEFDQHAKIWTQEVALGALRNVPFLGSVAEVAYAIRQRYTTIQTADRVSAVEAEVTGIKSQMRDLVTQTVTNLMQELRQPHLHGQTLTNLVKEFKDIQEAGYSTALFEGLFLGTSHYDALKQMPQSYGSVLDRSEAMNPEHFPILIELDGQDRILAVPPASLSRILSDVSGQSDSRVIASNDVFAIPFREEDSMFPNLADNQQSERAESNLFSGVRYEKEEHNATFYKKRAEGHRNKNGLFGNNVDLLKSEISDYTEALRLEPYDVDSYWARGEAYRQLNDHDEAISDYTEALTLSSDRSKKKGTILFYRALSFSGKKDYEAAISDFTEALKIEPNNATYYSARAGAHCSGGDTDAALSDYTEALRLKPDGNCYAYRAAVYSMKRDYDAAISDHTEALRLDPNMQTHYVGRARAHEKKGDHNAAISDYTETLRLDTKAAIYYECRADIYRKIGEYESAISDYSETMRLEPSDRVAKKRDGAVSELRNSQNS